MKYVTSKNASTKHFDEDDGRTQYDNHTCKIDVDIDRFVMIAGDSTS